MYFFPTTISFTLDKSHDLSCPDFYLSLESLEERSMWVCFFLKVDADPTILK